MQIQFSKMHGLGNDFMVIDQISQDVRLSPELIARLSDRHTGIGFDQLLCVEPPTDPESEPSILISRRFVENLEVALFARRMASGTDSARGDAQASAGPSTEAGEAAGSSSSKYSSRPLVGHINTRIGLYQGTTWCCNRQWGWRQHLDGHGRSVFERLVAPCHGRRRLSVACHHPIFGARDHSPASRHR